MHNRISGQTKVLFELPDCFQDFLADVYHNTMVVGVHGILVGLHKHTIIMIIHIPITYLHIHAHTYTYLNIEALTYIYLHIPTIILSHTDIYSHIPTIPTHTCSDLGWHTVTWVFHHTRRAFAIRYENALLINVDKPMHFFFGVPKSTGMQ
jgi:hypothetical protein